MIPRVGALLMATTVLAGGCTTAPTRPDSAPALTAGGWPDNWRATGRLAVRDAGNGFSARFVWRETPDLSVIDVRGPLGVGAVHVTRTDQRIVLEDGRDRQSVEAPFEALEATLAARLGAPLPLPPLRYWLLGRPDPAGSVDLDRAAPGVFVQYGWTVTARGAGGPEAPRTLPREVTVEREASRIRVVIEEWQVPAVATAP
jgi:outer membrane lipoprotein LolB